jgi:hypothetical protein
MELFIWVAGMGMHVAVYRPITVDMFVPCFVNRIIPGVMMIMVSLQERKLVSGVRMRMTGMGMIVVGMTVTKQMAVAVRFPRTVGVTVE